MEAEAFLDSLTLGTWLPNVDLCETNELYTVRVELPGVDLKDISLTIRDAVVRVSGVKREPNVSQKLLCYYCLERRYGKFLREINLESVVDARRATAQLDNGVLIVELPKLVERRGRVLEIPIVRKKG
jgi:HSP20 family protein